MTITTYVRHTVPADHYAGTYTYASWNTAVAMRASMTDKGFDVSPIVTEGAFPNVTFTFEVA